MENQAQLNDFLYGTRYAADYNSCEVIAVYNVLVALGIKADICSFSDKAETFAGEHNAFLFMAYNDRNSLRAMIHTMCITKDENGYRKHNDFSKPECYSMLQEAVKEYKPLFFNAPIKNIHIIVCRRLLQLDLMVAFFYIRPDTVVSLRPRSGFTVSRPMTAAGVLMSL